MISFFGLYRSGDCSRSLPRIQFHTTALFSGRNRPRLSRESWISSVVPKMRSWPFSLFAKTNYRIVFPSHNFFSKIRRKTREIQKYERFTTFLRRKGFNVIKLCMCRVCEGPRPSNIVLPHSFVAQENEISRALGPSAHSAHI